MVVDTFGAVGRDSEPLAKAVIYSYLRHTIACAMDHACINGYFM